MSENANREMCVCGTFARPQVTAHDDRIAIVGEIKGGSRRERRVGEG
jgi:hypothetical protein